SRPHGRSGSRVAWTTESSNGSSPHGAKGGTRRCRPRFAPGRAEGATPDKRAELRGFPGHRSWAVTFRGMVRFYEEGELQQRKTEMQPRFPSPSLSTGLHAAGPFPSGPAATVPTWLVMASGAAFGIAVQILLQRFGLGLDDIRNDALAHRAATPHF